MPKTAGEKFDASKAILSTSVDTLIHRSWASQRFAKDSAGCQIFKNNALLKDLAKWADKHISIYKMNSFTYTLLTKQQFVKANSADYSNIFNPLLILNNY